MESTNASTIERVLLWMVSGLSGADLENACIAKLNVDPAQVKTVIDQARKQLTLAAEYNRNEMLGTALTRLNDIYSRCIRAGADGNGPNLAKALDVQKEINRLAGLYPDPSALGQPDGMGTQAGDDDLELLGSAAEALTQIPHTPSPLGSSLTPPDAFGATHP